MESLQEQIVEWANGAFPDATVLSSFIHLQREVREFEKALAVWTDRGAIAEEAADIVMILFHITGRWCGIDLLEAVREKLELNKGRRWGEPDADGVVEHIRD